MHYILYPVSILLFFASICALIMKHKFLAVILFLLSFGGCARAGQDFKAEQAVVEQQERLEAQKAQDEKARAEFLELWYKISWITVSYNNFWDSQFLPTTEGIGNGSMDRITGYKNFQELNQASNIVFGKLENLKAPTGLTKSQQQRVNDALKAYQNSVAMRVTSTKKLMEMVDYNVARPSDVNKVMDDLSLSLAGTMVLYNAMHEVAGEMNITLPSEQSEYERHNKEIAQ